MTTLRNRLLGLAASLALLALVIGLPALLLALTPTYVPDIGSWDNLVAFLASPNDGTLAWLAIWALGWTVWVGLTGLVLTEVIAALRRIRAPQLRLLGWPQNLVRNLVVTAALLFIATPTLTALPAPVAAAQPVPAGPTPDPADTQAKRDAIRPATIDYVVQPGDSLWEIAKRHLGDGNRYPEIVNLNTKLLRRGADFIRQGWTLKLPAVEKVNGYERYTVRKGDTLSEIALEELGDAHAWPKIADASRSIIQPDGRRLTDPDEIDIGWTLHIPTRAAVEPEAAPSRPEPVDEPAPAPTPTATNSSPAPTPLPTAVTPTANTSTSTPEPSQIPKLANADSDAEDVQPPWMLIGITGGGALLGGALWQVIKKLRARQLRHRRPGRFPTQPDPQLIPVERSVHLAASTGAEDHVQYLDATLKSLATSLSFAEQPMPQLAAVHLSARGITLHLAEPVEHLADPWVGEGAEWFLAQVQFPEPNHAEQVAPFPLLVTVGSDDDGGIWLVNPEQYATVTISGDADYADDLARHLAAQIAVNPWAEDARVECIGVAGEIRPLNPVRIHHHDKPTHIVDMVTEAVEHSDRLDQTTALDTPTARATDAGYDVWQGRLILLAHQHAGFAEPLRNLICSRPGRTGAAVILVARDGEDDSRLHLNVSSDGRLDMPELGLDLVAVGITSDEAGGFAQLVEQANVLQDAPIPVNTEAVGWESLADVTGAIRAEHTLPRDTPDDPNNPASSILPAPDEAYLDTASTTADDLNRLAPKVTTGTTKAVAAADPTLDADLREWRDPASTRPKLRLLGPVSLQLGGSGEPAAADTGKAALLELLAFLATRTRGATTQQVADAMRIAEGSVRSKVGKLRDWLGEDPYTGQDYVPLMHQTDIAKATGIPAYGLRGVLVDADLFRRLHLRGKTRGTDGLDDLKTALTLVTGEPLTGFKDRRGNWVYDGDRPDQQYIVAIADVAHIVSTAALEAGDKLAARQLALVAIKASPAEEIARRDYEAAGGDLSDRTQIQESLFSDDEDWPDRTRAIEGRAYRRAPANRVAR